MPKLTVPTKKTFIKHFSAYWHIYIVALIFLVASAITLLIFRNNINPDGISYIQVARNYAEFDFKTAINGYWAPLLSWLITPFIWVGVDPLYAFRIINFLLPAALMTGLLYYLNKGRARLSNSEKYIQLAFLGSFGISLSIWSVATVTPDVLSGIVLLTTIGMLYMYLKAPTLRYALLFGVSLSLLYFAKSIGFYVAVALIIAVLGVEFYKRKTITKNSLIALAVFLATSLTWVGLISVKYDHLTISTAGSYNFALYGPTHPPHPQTVEGYLAVEKPDAIWGWDDPSRFKVTSWNVQENSEYYFHYVLKVANETIALLFVSSPLILLGLWAMFTKKSDKNINSAGYFLAFCSLLILGGYSLIYVEQRYVWFVSIPVIAFGAVLLRDRIKNALPASIILTLVLLGSILSLVPIIQEGQQAQLKQGDLKHLARQSGEVLPDFAKVAGVELFQYCYFSTTQCVGYYSLNGDQWHDMPMIETMRKQGIEYYVSVNESASLPYLESVYAGKSSLHTCYDYYGGKNVDCPRTALNVYKL